MGFLLCLGLWDSLLEGRIKFQKILTAVNQLPQTDTWQEFEESGGDEFREKKASGMVLQIFIVIVCYKNFFTQLIKQEFSHQVFFFCCTILRIFLLPWANTFISYAVKLQINNLYWGIYRSI